MIPTLQSINGLPFYVDPEDEAWTPYRQQPFEPHVVERLRPLLPGRRFLDVGANIGYYTVLAALEGASEILAIEPSPIAYELLKTNLQHHKIAGSVEAVHCGLSNRVRPAKFVQQGRSSIFQIKKVLGAEDAAVLVPVYRLDVSYRWHNFDVVKIDVDGHDYEAARGMVNMLERCHPIIFAEFMPSILADPIGYLRFYTNLGYKIEVLGGSEWWVPPKLGYCTPEQCLELIDKVPSYLDLMLT